MPAEGVFSLEELLDWSIMTKIRNFFSKIMFLLPSFLSLIGLLFTFAPMYVIHFKDKTVDPSKWTKSVNIVQFFGDFKPFHFVFILFLVFVVVGIVFSLIYKKNKSFGFISLYSFVVAMCLFFSQGLFYGYNHVYAYKEMFLGWGGIVTSILLALSIFIEFIIAYQNNQMSIRDIAEDGMLISMAFVLHLIKIPVGATGGSINLQFFPLFLIALRHGPIHGFMCASIIYGLISWVSSGYSIATYPFDYFLGFSGVAFFGIFSKFIFNKEGLYNIRGMFWIFISGTLALLTRWFGSTLSSVLNYNVTFVEGLAYNIPYVFFSGIAAIIVMLALYGPIVKLNEVLNRKKGYRDEE